MKTRRVQRGGALVEYNGKTIGEYDDVTGQGRADYPGVGVYEGHFENGVPHGRGTMTYDEGDVYAGEWKNDVKNGHGIMTYDGGDVYAGEWENDEKNGHGIMTYKDIGVYTGNWANDEKNGLGTVTFIDGREYTGNWENDERNGQGTSRRSNGDVEYEGEWSNNKKNGKGKMTYDNRDVYDGEWYADYMHGKGKMAYDNGDVYDGEWNYDSKHKEGTMIYADGSSYKGEWQNDVKHGTGEQKYIDGRVYNGLWKDGVEHPLFVNGVLADNEEYKPDLLPPFSPPIHQITLSYTTTGMDLIAYENKWISQELTKLKTFVMKIHGAYYVTSIDDIIKHMNDKNNIKYACTRKCPGFVHPPPPPPPVQFKRREGEEEGEDEEEDEEDGEGEEEEQQPVEPVAAFSIDTDVDKTVPYLSINSLFGLQGLVPIFELWSAIQSGHNAYVFVPTDVLVKFIASHATAYKYGYWMSSNHCEDGFSQQVYKLERLDIQFDPGVSEVRFANKIKIALRRNNALKTVKKLAKRAKEYEISRREFHDWYVKDKAVKDKAASTIQRFFSRKQKGGKMNKNLLRKTRRNRK